MKYVFSMFASLLTVTPVFANVSVSPLLKNLDIAQVGDVGTVLKTNAVNGVQSYLVGVPVSVNLGDACTTFAGEQAVTNNMGMLQILVFGSFDSTQDNCVADLPAPITTQLTFRINALANGFGTATYAQANIAIGSRVYLVTVDPTSQMVSVMPNGLQVLQHKKH